MRVGAFAKIFAGRNPAEVLSAARRAGFETVQYNMSCSALDSLPEAITAATAAEVAEAAAASGVDIAAVSATYNMIHPDPAERERGRRAFVAIASAARRMGTHVLTLCTGTRDGADAWRAHADNSTAAAFRELCDEFARILPVAERREILLGVEPEPANVICSAGRARELLDTLRDARVRIVLDAANLCAGDGVTRQRDRIAEAMELLGDSIVLAHAKDRRADGRVTAAGNGVLDYRFYLGALREAGFTGSVIAHAFEAGEGPRVAAFLKSELASIEAGG